MKKIFTREEVFEILIKIIFKQLEENGISKKQIVEEVDLNRDLGASSLDVVEIIVEVEDTFNINCLFDGFGETITVKALLNTALRAITLVAPTKEDQPRKEENYPGFFQGVASI